MPEYVTFEVENTDDPDVRLLFINQRLTSETEVYETIDDVPDANVRNAIRAAIAEWEQKYIPGT